MNQANKPTDQMLEDEPGCRCKPTDQMLQPGCRWPEWRTSTASDLVECVAVASLDGTVGVRNSRDPSGVTLILPRSVFGEWLDRIKAGELDNLDKEKAAPGAGTSEGRKPPQRRGDCCTHQE